tara:strand:+ start:1482 stop:1793 length:312 start_codon:yes stop_codon:yes gene_type:complete
MPTAEQIEARDKYRFKRKLQRQVDAKEKSLVKTKELLKNAEKNNRLLRLTLEQYERDIRAYKAIELQRLDLRARYDHQLDQNFKLQERIIELNKTIHELGKSK